MKTFAPPLTPWLRLGAAVLASGCVVFGACSDDSPAPADTLDTNDVAAPEDTADTSTEDSENDTTEPVDVAPDVVEPEDIAADTAPPDDVVIPTEPGRFVLGTAALPNDYVFKGVWAGLADRIVAVGNDGVIATQFADGTWDVLANAEGAALFNAISGPGPNQLWAVGSNTTILRGSADTFGATSACDVDADCADGDTCTINRCVDNVCQVSSTGAPGCCGTSPAAWNFDGGALAPWVPSPSEQFGPWAWQVVSAPQRAVSGTHALYFGNANATPPTYDAPGQRVSAVVVSPTFRIPASGTANLRFRVFVDTEDDPEYDFVSIHVDAAGQRTEIWHKRDLAFVPTGGFVDAEADLRPWLGQQVSLRIRFDSIDDSSNLFEGVYLDDVRVETTCTGTGAVATTRGPALWGVHAFANDFAVAVGQGGTILQWDGQSWNRPSGADASASWNAMSGLGNTLAFVGNDGVAAIARGAAFSPVVTGTTFSLHGVHIAAADQFVAVGDSGVALHGTNNTWTRVTTGTTANLRDVHGVPGDLWAVGANGTLLNYNGSGWTAVPSGTTNNLFGVWRLSESKVIAVGRDGVVVEGNANDGFAETARLASGADLVDLWSSNDGTLLLAVGQSGRIFARRGGSDWVQETSPTSQNLDTVWGSDANNVWLVGRAGTLVRWDTGTAAWVRVESPVTAPLTGVWGDAADRFFAAGVAGTIIVWDGEGWSAATGGTAENLRGVFLRSRSDGWAVGANGTVMRYRGLGWAKVPVMVDAETELAEELYGVWAFAGDDAWAVGTKGTIIRWNGTVWEVLDVPWETTLRGLYALAPNDMWAVGNEGQVLHWNGVEWTRVETGSIATLHAIHGDGRGHVIAVGSLGTVLKLERD
jgi:hypothetical protein